KARLGIANPEGIGDAPDGTIGRHQHDIKAHPRRAMAGVGGKPSIRRRNQPGALPWPQRKSRFGEGGARLHFNESKQALAFGDQVNLPGFSADSLAKQHPAFGGKGLGSQRFRPLPRHIGAPATQKAMGGWGLTRHGAILRQSIWAAP
ncbi:MAG: hypothetical protein RLZZ235_900, partial [Pseudomonadota bacterium]